MNALELQALRRIFDMTIEECTIYITQIIIRQLATMGSWRHTHLSRNHCRAKGNESQRQRRINAIVDKINNRIGNNTMRYFPDLSSFQSIYTEGDFIEWKIYQSVAAELFAHDLERLC